MYLAPSLLCFVGVVMGVFFDEDIRPPVVWGTLPVRHGFGRLGECPDCGRQCGFGDLRYHAGICCEVAVYSERPRLVGVVAVREGQGECLFDLCYCPWVYGIRVVAEGVLGGVPVCTGGTSRGLHGLRSEGVVERDVVEAVDFSGPPCPPVRSWCEPGYSGQLFTPGRGQRQCRRPLSRLPRQLVLVSPGAFGRRPQKAVPTMVAMPWVLMKRCIACVSCT